MKYDPESYLLTANDFRLVSGTFKEQENIINVEHDMLKCTLQLRLLSFITRKACIILWNIAASR